MLFARQSTAIVVTVGPVLDASGAAVTDGVAGDFKISKNGGAPAALNGSATLTHRHTGHYSLSLTTSDVGTVGTAEVVIDDTVNACPVKEIQVVEEAVYDALFAASAPGYVANAPVTLADGVTHGGSTAKLRLGTSGSTPALHVSTSGVLVPAARFESTAAATAALQLKADTSSGSGLHVLTDTGACLVFTSANGPGWDITGATAGMNITNTTAGTSVVFGGATSDIELGSSTAPTLRTALSGVESDVVKVSGDAPAADNLEKYLDGTEFMPVDSFAPKWSVSGTTLTVKKPDGTTTAYTRSLSTVPDASADDITGSS